ncbi:MAG TPA: hypothetical protein PLS94_05320 [Prolixibacteraceae bacterium]|nr:hypothetical protein [Prolixibacteraceae bacterium]
MKRKEFIDNVFRYGMLGGLVLLTGFLLLKRNVKTEGRSCADLKICRNCKKFEACTLPEKKL